jgi:hypothetical protein
MIADPISETSTTGALGATTLTPETRLPALIDEADAIVRKAYPGAQLLAAEGELDGPEKSWRFVFKVPAAGFKETSTTAILTWVDGEFRRPPHYVEETWADDAPIPRPLALDAAGAQELARQAGYHGNAASACLRWVRSPGVDEPHWILTLPDRDLRVYVGVHSREVEAGPLTI